MSFLRTVARVAACLRLLALNYYVIILNICEFFGVLHNWSGRLTVFLLFFEQLEHLRAKYDN